MQGSRATIGGGLMRDSVSPHPNPLPRGVGTAIDCLLLFVNPVASRSALAGGKRRNCGARRHRVLAANDTPSPGGEGRGEGERLQDAHQCRGWSSRWPAPYRFVLCALLLLRSDIATARDSFTRLKADEQIVFFPTIGQRVPGKDVWRLEIHGCVFEPEKRRMTMAVLRESLDLKDIELTPAEEKIFNERARLFLVDHERGKQIFVRIGDKNFDAGESKADGYFTGEILLPDSEIRRLRKATNSGNWRIHFAAELPPGDTRAPGGELILIEETGLSVISDIDDTIKITQVRDRRATLRNTFLRPFEPTPGMAELYQNLARSNHAEFHYVSASPWQLYLPLAEFIRTNGFPSGTFALKQFRWKDRSFLSLFADPEKYKPSVIEPLLKRFPNRQFLLIGDSGERDPEVYAALARKYPQQIVGIWIRDVTDEPATAERYQKVFRDLPRELWQLFKLPLELSPLPNTPIRSP